MMTWKHKWTHYIGITSSLLCLVHCLALPLLLLVFPTLAIIDFSTLDSFWEYVFVAMSVTSVLTIINAHKVHQQFSSALIIAFLGVVLLTVSLYMPHSKSMYFLTTGSLFILIAHVLNLRMCHINKKCCNHTHHHCSTATQSMINSNIP
ncbi:MAG: MerC domain-containing protein [Bdellovibrionaceae bacterium]|nr:MerC domain-containing protein [Pseudobdellovibrionaceae bacterium]